MSTESLIIYQIKHRAWPANIHSLVYDGLRRVIGEVALHTSPKLTPLPDLYSPLYDPNLIHMAHFLKKAQSPNTQAITTSQWRANGPLIPGKLFQTKQQTPEGI